MKILVALAAAARLLTHAWYGPDAPETRAEEDGRRQVIVEAAARQAALQAHGWASQLGLGTLALVVAHEESGGFDLRIHAGGKHPKWTQDHGLATCLTQIHASAIVPDEAWRQLAGTSPEATERCMGTTMRLLRGSQGRCKLAGAWDEASVARVMAAYASGGNCEPGKRELERAHLWARLYQEALRPHVVAFR